MATFEIRTWYEGRGLGAFRKITTVEAPTGMHALRSFAGNRQAIIRPRKTGTTNQQWMATILIGNGRLRDYIAVRV